MFHDTYGYYADGVGPDTAKMPNDWMDFAKLHYIGDITVICPDLHDLAVSKYVAGRDKDAHWVRGLLRHGLIELPRLVERLSALDFADTERERLRAWARHRAAETSRSPAP